jgi:hypothetical protein
MTITIDPDTLAQETLALPNEAAWAAMGARLAIRSIKRPGEIRDAAWAIRRRLLKERALSAAAERMAARVLINGFSARCGETS